jgi:hypothetical protein
VLEWKCSYQPMLVFWVEDLFSPLYKTVQVPFGTCIFYKKLTISIKSLCLCGAQCACVCASVRCTQVGAGLTLAGKHATILAKAWHEYIACMLLYTLAYMHDHLLKPGCICLYWHSYILFISCISTLKFVLQWWIVV